MGRASAMDRIEAMDRGDSTGLGSGRGGSEAGIWMMRMVVAIVLYVMVAGAMSPGFIALGSPLHSDVYRYYEIARAPLSWGVLASPRPLMLAALGVLDVDDFRFFYCALLLPSVLLPVFMLAALERVRGMSVGMAATIAYLALSYSLPSFYELAPLDFGGALAGIVACAAIIVLSGGAGWLRVLAYAALVWVSLEFKPTYAFVLCAVPLLTARPLRPHGVAAAAAAFAVAIAVFLKDRWLGSAFVGVGAQAGGSYQLFGQPGVIVAAFGFYLQRLFSPMGWMLLLGCVAWLVAGKRWRLPCAIAVLAAAAILPMLLIPNHRFVMYAWYPSSILLLLLPLAAMAPPHSWRPVGAALLAVGTLLACIAEARFLPVHRAWYTHNQQANANVLASLDALGARLSPGERVLISGRLAPYVPFKNDGFMARRLPQGVDWVVVAPPDEDALIPMSPDTRRYRSMSAIDGTQFDVHVEYGADGRIDRLGPPDPALGAGGDTPLRRELLFCAPAVAAPDANTKTACLAEIH